MIPLALLAGAGLGFGLGILFARMDQSKVFDLMTSTVDRLTTSALFPGLKGVVGPSPETSAEGMFDDLGIDTERIPAFLKDEEDEPWDYSGEPVKTE